MDLLTAIVQLKIVTAPPTKPVNLDGLQFFILCLVEALA